MDIYDFNFRLLDKEYGFCLKCWKCGMHIEYSEGIVLMSAIYFKIYQIVRWLIDG